MPWGVSMYSLLIYVLNRRRKGHGVCFGGVLLRGLRWYSSLSLGSKEDHGRTGEGGAPAAPSVPVPRPVARGLADWRQVRTQLAPFTHGALVLLRICSPRVHHITLCKKYSLYSSLWCHGLGSVNVLEYFTVTCAAVLLRMLQQVYWFTRSTVCADATVANSTNITPK